MEQPTAIPPHSPIVQPQTLEYNINNTSANQGAQGIFHGPVQIYQQADEHQHLLQMLAGIPCGQVPTTAALVGRDDILARLRTRLAQQRVIAIIGMAGVGKTALAATLAQHHPAGRPVFWHTCTTSTSLESLIWLLARFLAQQEQPDLLSTLHKTHRAGGAGLPAEILISYLIQQIAEHDYLLCLDDVHLIDHIPTIGQLIGQICALPPQGGLRLLLTARQAPGAVQESDIERLSGLDAPATQALLNQRGITLAPPQTEALHRQTGGNPQLLLLAVNALQLSSHPDQVITNLLDAPNIEQYLLRQVDTHLQSDERRLMEGIAVLLEEGGTRPLLEALLPEQSIRAALLRLSERQLLQVQPSPDGPRYRQHAIIRAFYYQHLAAQTRQCLHRRAAEHYRHRLKDDFLAAQHHACAGDYEQAADLASASSNLQISAGRGQALCALLEQLRAQPLDQQRWAGLTLLHGQILTLLQPGEQAQQCFQAVLTRLEGQITTPAARLLAARACRGIGELLEQQQPALALTWLERGMELLGDNDPAEQAHIQRRCGSVHTKLGDLAAASEALHACLRLIPAGSGELRAGALLNLGVIAAQHGALDHSEDYLRQALAIYRSGSSRWRELGVQHNLGNLMLLRGEWSQAAETYRAALKLAQEFGLVYQQVELGTNLGVLLCQMGALEPAQVALAQAHTLASTYGLSEANLYVCLNLVELAIRQGQWETATRMLAETEMQTWHLGMWNHLPEVYASWARIQLERGDSTGGLANARRAVREARQRHEPQAEGSSLRVLGQALLACGQPEAAACAFAESSTLLADDPYEQARTLAAWGCALHTQKRSDAHTLLEQARTTFTRLGAQHDLERLCRTAVTA